MSRFTGPQHKGAQRELRAVRRQEAEERNAGTPLGRRAGSYVMSFSDGCATFHTADGGPFGGIGGTHDAASHTPWMRSRYSEELIGSLMTDDV